MHPDDHPMLALVRQRARELLPEESWIVSEPGRSQTAKFRPESISPLLSVTGLEADTQFWLKSPFQEVTFEFAGDPAENHKRDWLASHFRDRLEKMGVPSGVFETGYDLIHRETRYPPKAILGIAAARLKGAPMGPGDFSSGETSFRVLRRLGFVVLPKGEGPLFPDEVGDESHVDGSVTRVTVNRYERDPNARKKCISHYGAMCQVCGFDFAENFGMIGAGFIHVHHLVPLSDIRGGYVVDPLRICGPSAQIVTRWCIVALRLSRSTKSSGCEQLEKAERRLLPKRTVGLTGRSRSKLRDELARGGWLLPPRRLWVRKVCLEPGNAWTNADNSLHGLVDILER